MKKNKIGFTLIELLVAMAIITLLAAVVLVQFQGYAKGARASKALAQLSSAVPAMYSCWGNGGKVNKPASTGSTAICSLGSSYGTYPSSVSDLSSYSYGSAPAASSGDKDYCTTGCMSRTSWYVYLDSSTDNKRICCNKTVNGCASTIKASGIVCDQTGWTD